MNSAFIKYFFDPQTEFSLLVLWDWILGKLDFGNRTFNHAYTLGMEDMESSLLQLLRKNYYKELAKHRIREERTAAILEEETHG